MRKYVVGATFTKDKEFDNLSDAYDYYCMIDLCHEFFDSPYPVDFFEKYLDSYFGEDENTFEFEYCVYYEKFDDSDFNYYDSHIYEKTSS